MRKLGWAIVYRLVLLLAIAVSTSACSTTPKGTPSVASPSALATSSPLVASASSAASPSPAVALPTFTSSPTAVPGELYVDPAQSLGPISPLIYGTNSGPWTGIGIETRDEVEAARLTFLRFPGGDPTIKLLGPDTHQFTPDGGPKDPARRYWMREFLLANGNAVDIVALRRYPFSTGMDQELPAIKQLRENTREWDAIIPALRSLIRETTWRDIPIAVTEINSNWIGAVGGEGTPDSFYNAIWWGDVLGRMIKHDVSPTYYVYLKYKLFGDGLVYTDDQQVSIYSARRQDGALTLLVINLGSEEAVKQLSFANFMPAAEAEAWRFDQETKASQIDPAPAGALMSL